MIGQLAENDRQLSHDQRHLEFSTVRFSQGRVSAGGIRFALVDFVVVVTSASCNICSRSQNIDASLITNSIELLEDFART